MKYPALHRKSQMVLRLLALGLLATLGGLAVQAEEGQSPPAGERVFFTGHSFHMFVPRQMGAVAKAAGIQDHHLAGMQGIGGSRVYQHWNLEDDKNQAKKALKTGMVDVFTMAAHLTVPDDGITKFTALGLEHNPNLRLLVQESWYPFDVASPEHRIRDNKQRDDMKIADLEEAMNEWRTRLEMQADALNKQHARRAVFIVPAGDAVVKLRALVVGGKFPGVKTQSELFTDPIGHAGPHVQTLATYCNFVAIYGMDPTGLEMPNSKAVTQEQQQILQKIAWETVSNYPYAGVEKTKIIGK